MTDPPRPIVGANDVREDWLSQIQSLLRRCRSDAGPEPDPDPPAWLTQAARQVVDLMHERIDAALAHAAAGTTELRARLADTEAGRVQARRELDLLRDNVRNFLADTVANQAAPDRSDANQALRAWGIDTLPARYTVTLTVTLDATVIADDDEDAEGQAQQILQELARHDEDETVELGEIHTDQISEHDEPPEPVR